MELEELQRLQLIQEREHFEAKEALAHATCKMDQDKREQREAEERHSTVCGGPDQYNESGPITGSRNVWVYGRVTGPECS